MTSLEVKLSVVPGWKWSGHMIADCFDVSDCGAVVGSMVVGVALVQRLVAGQVLKSIEKVAGE